MRTNENSTYLVRVDHPTVEIHVVCGAQGRFPIGNVRHEEGFGWTVHAPLAADDEETRPYGDEAFGTAEEAADALYRWYVQICDPDLEV